MIMETMCEKNELHIDGYAIETTKKRKDKWGGILFAIRKEFEHQVEIVSESIDPAEVLFVQLTCGRLTATIGLVYAPQENDLTVGKMDEMYKYISDEVGKAAADGHVVILGGDFNCKIGESIKGNKKEVSKGGRRLLKMTRNSGLAILNANDKCNGVWTRIQQEQRGEKRSVLDYMLITEEHEALVKSMDIDEQKTITPYRDDSLPGRPVHTDHNMITLNLNLQIQARGEEIKINRKKIAKFKETTEKTQLLELIKTEQNKDLKETYTKWNEKIIEIVRTTCAENKNKKRQIKEIRIMRRKRTELKKQLKKEKDRRKREFIKKRRKVIQQHIVRRNQKEKKQKVVQVANEIMGKGMFNRGAYWDFMKKIKSRKTVIKGRSINDENGNRLTEPEKIKNRYAQFYK